MEKNASTEAATGLAPEATLPKTARGRARVRNILEVARKIFMHGGLIEMTMRQVADGAGIRLSNLQHYFPSRESLLKALIQDIMDEYDVAFDCEPSRINDPKARLEAALRYLLADSRKPDTERLFVEIWSLATRDPMVRALFDEMYCHHRQNIAELIINANPDLPPLQAQRRAALIAMQIEGLMLLISDAKPAHAELVGIDEDCVAFAMSLALAPPGRP